MKEIPIYKNKSLEDLEGEKWQEIPFTEGYYMVSNLGRVKALARMIYSDTAQNGRWIKEKILSQWIGKNKNDHTGDQTFELIVTYQFEGTRTAAMVRRLVYEAFVFPETKQKMDDKYVYPLDGNGLNCRWDNLGLASIAELRTLGLQRDRYIPPVHLLPKEFYVQLAKKAGHDRRRKINKYKPDGTLITTYPSITSAAEMNKVSIGCIGMCAQKKLKTLKGYVYRYADEGYQGELKNWEGVNKKIVQYSISGERIAVFESINEAGRQLNIEPGTISRAAKKRSKHAGGFVWRYEDETYAGEYKGSIFREFIQYDHKGEMLAVFDSISEAAKQTCGSYEGIRLALNGKTATSGGFIWKWK